MIEVFCETHAEKYPCHNCGATDKPVASLGEEYGYEFCADCLKWFLSLIRTFGAKHGCELCAAEEVTT